LGVNIGLADGVKVIAYHAQHTEMTRGWGTVTSLSVFDDNVKRRSKIGLTSHNSYGIIVYSFQITVNSIHYPRRAVNCFRPEQFQFVDLFGGTSYFRSENGAPISTPTLCLGKFRNNLQ
jgi:hypothetical protein